MLSELLDLLEDARKDIEKAIRESVENEPRGEPYAAKLNGKPAIVLNRRRAAGIAGLLENLNDTIWRHAVEVTDVPVWPYGPGDRETQHAEDE